MPLDKINKRREQKNIATKKYADKKRALGLCYCGRERINNLSKCQTCRDATKKYKEKFKSIVYTYYGNKCNCCGEAELLFLQIDHVNNDGYLDRKIGNTLYKYIIENNFPNTFQLLCANCNFGKKMNNGKCPHGRI